MNKPLPQAHPMETQLQAYYQRPAPSETFISRLEAQITAELQAQDASRPAGEYRAGLPGLRSMFSRRWAQVSVLLVTLAVLVLALLGPQRAMARLLHVFGYVPGIGFVDAQAARVLAEPVMQQQDGVTLQVTQILATEQGTTVVIEGHGLPPRDEMFGNNAKWKGEQPEGVNARIHLLDGTVLESNGGGAGIGKAGEVVLKANFDFPPLPPMVYHAVLEVPFLPLIPPGAAPGNWVLPFSLAPVADDQPVEQGIPTVETGNGVSDDVPPAVVLPQATEVDAHSQPAASVSLQVVNAVYTASETALQVQVNGLAPDWRLQPGLMAELTDAQGNGYAQQYPPSYGTENGSLQSLVFDPVPVDGRQLTLHIERLIVDVPSQGREITLDMGQDPQVGDTLPINQTVDVYGLPVEFRSVTLSDSHAKAEGRPATINFAFEMAPVPVLDNLSISMLGFGPTASEVFGGHMMGSGGGNMGPSAERVQLVLDLDYDATQPLPTGVLALPLDGIQLGIGPLEVSWQTTP